MTWIKKKSMKLLWMMMAVLLLAGCTASSVPESVPTAQAKESAVCEVVPEVSKEASESEAAAEAAKETTESEAAPEASEETTPASEAAAAEIEEDGVYDTKDEVALYLHTYGHLPDNYITKKEAESLGWNSKKGNLWEVAPGKSIGGSHFGNYEGQLPEKKGRKYYECDLDYDGGYRGAKRLIYSNDGLVFYTEDHYKTFEQLY